MSKGTRVGDESRERVGEIVPGLVVCGEDFAFTLSELGATGRLSGGTGADLGVNRILLTAV